MWPNCHTIKVWSLTRIWWGSQKRQYFFLFTYNGFYFLNLFKKNFFFFQLCKKNLEGKGFFVKAGKPFCKSHARMGIWKMLTSTNHSAAVVAWVCYNVHKMWAFSTISSLDFVISTAYGEIFLSNNKQVCKKNIILWRCDFAFIQNNYYYYYYLPQKNRQIVLILIPPKKPIFCKIVFSFYLKERKKV